MSRISTHIAAIHKAGHKALIPYLVAGDPSPGVTVDFMHQLVAAGADIIELGIPFSDPMAEGPVIQRAHERALEHHTSLTDALAMVAQFRQRDSKTPVVLMGYANPVEVMGYDTFAQCCVDAGVDGVLTVDLPPEESADLATALKAKDIDVIYLLAPTTTDERIQTICDSASGYIYYVSLKGVTGAANLDVEAVDARIRTIRTMTDLPLCVGFGISNPEAAASVGQVADGVVVGSALVKQFDDNVAAEQAVSNAIVLLSSMRSAMDA